MPDYVIDPAEWVLAHGSQRLKKSLDLGMLPQSMTVYHEERIKHELPGFEPLGKRNISARRNPQESELDALADARVAHPTAQLISLDLVEAWTPAITIPLPWDPKRTAVKILERK